MICLVLTIFANLFPAGEWCGRGRGSGWGRAADPPDACHAAGPAACSGVHERTFLAVKPDGVQRRLVGEIVRRLERKGFKLVALKLVQVEAGVAGGDGKGGALEHAARSSPFPGLRGPAARALLRAARAPLLRPPGQVHELGTGGGHGKWQWTGGSQIPC